MKKISGFMLFIVLSLLAGCKTESLLSESTKTETQKTSEKETVKLTWALMDFGADMTACQEALNDCMKDKGLPYEIEFVDIPIKYEGDHQVYVNSYIEKIKAGEYDIVNCMGIVGCYDIYEIAIEEGILSPFGDFLEKEEMGKELKQAYPTVVWESLKYGGDIYGVLTPYTDFKFYAVFNLDYVEKYKVDLSKITFDNMESILQKVKEEKKD